MFAQPGRIIQLKIPAIYKLYFKAMVRVFTNHIPLYFKILQNLWHPPSCTFSPFSLRVKVFSFFARKTFSTQSRNDDN